MYSAHLLSDARFLRRLALQLKFTFRIWLDLSFLNTLFSNGEALNFVKIWSCFTEFLAESVTRSLLSKSGSADVALCKP